MDVIQLLSYLLLIFVSTNIPGNGNTMVSSVSAQCQSSEQALLLQIKSTLAFNSSLSISLSQWDNASDCCTWTGVGCDDIGQVVSLSLANESITGIDDSSNLFHLEYLQRLDLSYNLLQSSEIPSKLGNLTNLTHLNLRNCNFTGPIPASMANLTSLKFLDLSNNRLTGSLPQFYKLKLLVELDLQNNSLAGDISSIKLEELPNLSTLHLNSNSFNGSILPSFSNASSSLLDFLDLSHNRFEGSIPESIFELSSLTYLDLSSNMFNGSVHLDTIERLGGLFHLDLSYNKLAVNVSSNFTSFPSNLNSLGLASCNISHFPNVGWRLITFDLSDNRISGDIPDWVWQCSYLNLSHNSLVSFEKPDDLLSMPWVVDLHSNQLQGNIPHQLYSASFVDISDNNFNSSLPDVQDNASTRCVFLSVSNNKLTGVIPNSICNFSLLQVLDLSNNNLNGGIPLCLVEGSGINVLNLNNNSFSGTIPDRFPSNCSIQTLSLNGNLLQGTLPKSVSDCRSLEVLDVGKNNLSGGFPCWLKDLSSLHVLILRSNKLYGDVNCIGNNSWSALQILDLAFNKFSGELPRRTWTYLKGMMIEESESELKKLAYQVSAFSDYFYDSRVVITLKGNEIQLVKILTIFTSIDLSSNNLRGSIPEEMILLKSLHLLNLSRNSFTGSIPTTIEKIERLESLDLSENNIQGHIPAQLASLNFLSVLNLSNNHLVGRIPTSTQLQSFSPTSFEGNEGLCGPPLKDCTNTLSQIPVSSMKTDPDSFEFGWQLALFIGVGFGTGFIVSVAPLIVSDKVNLWYEKFIHKNLGHLCK